MLECYKCLNAMNALMLWMHKCLNALNTQMLWMHKCLNAMNAWMLFFAIFGKGIEKDEKKWKAKKEKPDLKKDRRNYRCWMECYKSL